MPNPSRRFAMPTAVRIGLAGFATSGVLLSVVGLPGATPAAQAAEPDAVADVRPLPQIPGVDLEESTAPARTRVGPPIVRLKRGGGLDVAAVPARAAAGKSVGAAGSRARTARVKRLAKRPAQRPTVQMDARTLSKAMGGTVSLHRYQELVPAFNKALAAAHANTVRRVAMFTAQVGHESVGLKYMEEIASGADYNGRVDLGNTHPGDGERFKGRGPIQVTGRHNYREVSRWAYRQGLVPTRDYFVEHPGRLASDRQGFKGVVWYWTQARDMNSYADDKDIVGATEAVNGGTNGLEDRVARWHRALDMGDELLGKDQGKHAGRAHKKAHKKAHVKAHKKAHLKARAKGNNKRS